MGAELIYVCQYGDRRVEYPVKIVFPAVKTSELKYISIYAQFSVRFFFDRSYFMTLTLVT